VSPETSGEFISLARVVKTQGRRGEVAARVHSDVPDRFVAGMKLFALPKSPRLNSEDARRKLEVEELWPHKGLLVLKFRGIDSMSDAEELVGSELQVPRAERAELEQGWTYVSDLVGCAVLDRGNEIGRIEDVQLGAGEAPLLVVANRSGRKFDLPFAAASPHESSRGHVGNQCPIDAGRKERATRRKTKRPRTKGISFVNLGAFGG